MSWPTSLQVALKEWAVVCRALEEGEQIILLRKGGIYESAGEFELEHRQFLVFPTYLHQNTNMLKLRYQAALEPHSSEPSQVELAAAGVVTDIIQLQSRAQMDALDSEHVWAPPLIDMRFNYRPHNPLYLLLVRAYRLGEPVRVENTPAYAGCKSWVPLQQPIALNNLQPAIADAEYDKRRERIMAAAAEDGVSR
jgi:hypothetical protein